MLAMAGLLEVATGTSAAPGGACVARSRAALRCRSSLTIALAVSCLARVGLAQPEALEDGPALGTADSDAEEPVEDAESDVEAKLDAGADSEVVAEPTPPRTAPNETSPPAPERTTHDVPDLEQKNGFVKPPSENDLSWAGSFEVDVGYANYTFENPTLREEEVYDFRGRFVFGPTLDYGFNQDWFLAARGEAVLWVREEFGRYLVNVDDAFAQVGKRAVWDFKLGRFRTWRVYHKGLGFDLFTLEDSGACVQNPCTADAGTFGPHTYEVSYIYDRETPGRGAFHVYPTDWSGIELAATYGQGGVLNTWGARAAAMLYFDFLRVMAAGEYRSSGPRQEQRALDPDNNPIPCEKCNVSRRHGFGGGVELTLKPIEVGLNAARGMADIYSQTTGMLDEGGSNTLTSLGGYAEVDVGSFSFQRSLILGFGLNRAESLAVNENFSQHYQGAAYVVYPLGFNAASVKLVLSRSELTSLSLIDPVLRQFSEAKSAMNAGRIRLTYPF